MMILPATILRLEAAVAIYTLWDGTDEQIMTF